MSRKRAWYTSKLLWFVLLGLALYVFIVYRTSI